MRKIDQILFYGNSIIQMVYGRRVKRSVRPKRKYPKRRIVGRKRMALRRVPRSITTNTASIKENYTVAIQDGNMTFFRNIALDDASYDRSQAVAQAFQEFRIKYVKYTFQPSADTFPLAAGNVIPQMYFMVDRANAIPTNATLQTLLDMGCKPKRFDAQNKVVVFKPSVLQADQTSAGGTTASSIKLRPWLSTNKNSGNIGAAWAPSSVDHQGLAVYITKVNPLTPAVAINVDVEVVFQFRKPLWRAAPGQEATQYQIVENGHSQLITT